MNHYGLDMLLKAGVWTRDQWPVYEFSYLITNLTSPIFIAKSAVFWQPLVPEWEHGIHEERM